MADNENEGLYDSGLDWEEVMPNRSRPVYLPNDLGSHSHIIVTEEWARFWRVCVRQRADRERAELRLQRTLFRIRLDAIE